MYWISSAMSSTWASRWAAICARASSRCRRCATWSSTLRIELIVRLFRSNEHRSEEAIHQAVSAIRESGAVEAALDEARGFVGRSRSALDQLPAGPARQAMQDLADFTVQRRT